jgi:putative hydrolase of the HAD superfamily
MIRCLAFDAVGTLIEPHPPVAEAYRAVGARHGSRYSAEELRPRFRAAFAAAESDDLAGEMGDSARNLVTSEEREHRRWRRIVSAVLDDAADPEMCFQDLWRHFGTPAAWRCFPDVAEAIGELRAAGFLLAVASNFDSRLHAVCNGLPPLDSIPRIVSSEAGHRKPSPQFFRVLTEAVRCAQDEILLVGDDLENDVRGAQAFGMRAAWLRRSRDVFSRDPAESLGILPGTPVIADLRELAATIRHGAC